MCNPTPRPERLRPRVAACHARRTRAQQMEQGTESRGRAAGERQLPKMALERRRATPKGSRPRVGQPSSGLLPVWSHVGRA